MRFHLPSRGNRLLALLGTLTIVISACSSGGASPSESGTAMAGASGSEGAAATPSQAPIKVSIATSGITLLWAHAWVADSQGFFKAEGLEAEVITTPGGVTGTQAVVSGNATLSLVPFGQILSAVAQNQPVKAVAATVTQNANTFIVSTKWANAHFTSSMSLDEKIKALKGARVGVIGPGSAVDDFARFVLASRGVDPDRDVTLVGLQSSANFAPALANDQVDAFVGGSPSAELSIVQGTGEALVRGPAGDIPEMAGQLFGVAVVQQKLIDDNPDLVLKLVRAIYRTEQFMTNTPDQARDLLRQTKFQKLDEPVWNMAWDDTFPSYATTPVMATKGYQINFDILKVARGDKAPAPIPFDQAVDNTFAQEAVQQLGS